MLVISIVLILVLALIVFVTKKKLFCFKRTQLDAFKKSDKGAVDELEVDEPEVGKKMDKSQSEFIKSVTGGSAEILNSPNFAIYPTGTRIVNRERMYRSKVVVGGVDENESDDSSSLNSLGGGGEMRVRYQSLEFQVHSSLNLRGGSIFLYFTFPQNVTVLFAIAVFKLA